MISSRRPGIGKRVFVLTLAATLLAVGVPTEGQQRAQPTRMGFLTTVPLATIADRLEAFRQGLHDLGYTEGENIVIEWRSTEGKEDRLPALAAELSRLKMQVIVSAGSSVTRVLKEATSSIPIVMALDADPVGNQFVASLARPGGNVTGLSLLSPEIAGKRLELLKEIVPKLSRVAVLGSSTRPGNAQELRETEHAAANLGLRIQYLDVRGSGDIETAFQAARKGAAEAVLVLSGPVLVAHRKALADLAVKTRLPAAYNRQEYMDAGGFMTYGPSITDLFRRSATYVDKILKGAKPADLPVEQPTKFELVINLKTAKQIGLTIPPNVLARADRVIK
jgi:putative ABC transport system substrate-binding protein